MLFISSSMMIFVASISNLNKFLFYCILGLWVIFAFYALEIHKSLAYGDCDYSEGSYGVDCDELAPTGSILINDDNSSTTSRNVTLEINATDDSGTVEKMMISEDPNFAGASWESYSTQKAFTLSSSYGTKTVYIKFQDGAGNISSIYFDRIIYVVSYVEGEDEYEETSQEEAENEDDLDNPSDFEEEDENIDVSDDATYFKLRLIDKVGNPLKGANIVIDGLDIQALTDDSGYIDIGFVDTGSYMVSIEYESETYSQMVELVEGEDISVLSLDLTKKDDDGFNWKKFFLIASIIGFLLAASATGYIYFKKDKFAGDFKN